ncbi:hypothetical protein CLAIMM_10502 isoform 1 [Cladophialophora immunda]|nr:hypothetical protein CLAIMM_10502 isoform 1 [Cladophialophora immunda]
MGFIDQDIYLTMWIGLAGALLAMFFVVPPCRPTINILSLGLVPKQHCRQGGSWWEHRRDENMCGFSEDECNGSQQLRVIFGLIFLFNACAQTPMVIVSSFPNPWLSMHSAITVIKILSWRESLSHSKAPHVRLGPPA